MKNLKEKLQWAAGKSEVVVVDTSFRNKKMLISPLWFMLYALVILGTTAFGLYFYNSLPQQLPLHWNIRGEIDRWADKSMKLLFIAPILQIFIMLLMMFIYWMIGKAKQSIDPANPERSVEQNRIFRFRWSAYIVFMGMGLMLVFAVMQAGIMGFIKDSSLIIFPILGFAALSIGGSILLSIKTGQGGSRIPTGRDDNKQVVNREDDKYWRLGMFYYNPDDPAVFVEKRFGIGWTNNFARPTSWVMLGGLLVFIFALPVIMIFLSK